MDPKDFLERIDDEEIVDTIRAAEAQRRGEIRVHVTQQAVGDAQDAAIEAFERLGMAATAERNGVLIYVAPRTRASRSSATRACMGSVARGSGGRWRTRCPSIPGRPLHRRHRAGVARTGEVLARFFPRVAGALTGTSCRTRSAGTDCAGLPQERPVCSTAPWAAPRSPVFSFRMTRTGMASSSGRMRPLAVNRRQEGAPLQPLEVLGGDAPAHVEAARGHGLEREVAGFGAVEGQEQVQGCGTERAPAVPRVLGDDRARVARAHGLGQPRRLLIDAPSP